MPAPAPQIFIHDTLGSTNDEAARLLTAGTAAPLVVIARQQTKGRGRFGRPWLSEPNGNLYISFGFRPRVTPARLQTFTLWAGVNICDLIATQIKISPAPGPGIKWPNDIFFGTRKAGGILTEARISAGNIDSLVLGLGLNLKAPAAGWPPELADIATSLAEQNPNAQPPLDTDVFNHALITRVLDAYEQLLGNPDATSTALAALWQKYDIFHNKTISVLSGNDRLTGIAQGIDSEGCLILKLADGRSEKIRAGEVTMEKFQIPKSKS